jgi:hypothetical protein
MFTPRSSRCRTPSHPPVRGRLTNMCRRHGILALELRVTTDVRKHFRQIDSTHWPSRSRVSTAIKGPACSASPEASGARQHSGCDGNGLTMANRAGGCAMWRTGFGGKGRVSKERTARISLPLHSQCALLTVFRRSYGSHRRLRGHDAADCLRKHACIAANRLVPARCWRSICSLGSQCSSRPGPRQRAGGARRSRRGTA